MDSDTDCVLVGLTKIDRHRNTASNKAPKRLRGVGGQMPAGLRKSSYGGETAAAPRMFPRGRSTSFGGSPTTPIYITSDDESEEDDCVLQCVSEKPPLLPSPEIVDVDGVTKHHQGDKTVITLDVEGKEEEDDEEEGTDMSPTQPPASSGTASQKSVVKPNWPPCWTTCPNCGPDNAPMKYHLIDIESGSDEWSRITLTMQQCGYVVTRLQRIQNSVLWQRLTYEIQLMKENRSIGFQINKTLLYHTSRAEKHVVCEEGLDPRLSHLGCFGRGIYFSDDPRKCNSYRIRSQEPRLMFACSVLLGDKKIYPRGKMDRSLVREPLKENVKLGEFNRYDSVVGNINNFNEYVVYNAYRVLPEYAIEYTEPEPEFLPTSSGTGLNPTPHPFPASAPHFLRPKSLSLRAAWNCPRAGPPMQNGFASSHPNLANYTNRLMRWRRIGAPPLPHQQAMIQMASPPVYGNGLPVLNPSAGFPRRPLNVMSGPSPVLAGHLTSGTTMQQQPPQQQQQQQPQLQHSTTTGYQGSTIHTLLNTQMTTTGIELPQSSAPIYTPGPSSLSQQQQQQDAFSLTSSLAGPSQVQPAAAAGPVAALPVCTICQNASCTCAANAAIALGSSATCKTCNRIPFCCICQPNPLLH